MSLVLRGGIVYDTIMSACVVLDTNVLLAALRSRDGASFQLLSRVGRSRAFEICLSVPLMFEYEEVAKRQSRELGLTHGDIDRVLDYLCSVARLQEIFFLWRPLLSDPGDDMLVELAVAGNCDAIVTFNVRDFEGINAFGLRAETPRSFLQRIGEVP
jgi:putative PIN family toxin of toxin-antitoxin system